MDDIHDAAEAIIDGEDPDVALANIFEAKDIGKANPPSWLSRKNMPHWRDFLDENPDLVATSNWPEAISRFKSWAKDNGIRLDSSKGGSRIAQNQ